MEDTPVAIKVDALSKSYPLKSGTKKALKDVSFEVGLGKICCLLGPNGSGKTTLLKILSGLLLPTSGSATLMGMDILEEPIKIRKQIGWMPADERSGFYGRLTGRENLNFFADLQQIPPKEVNRIIGNIEVLLGINNELNQQFLSTSSGERQKIGLARTLLHNPQVLLLDEPFRNLDPHTIIRFRRLLKDHMAKVQKKAILLSTHQLEEARKLADTLVILHQGRVIRQLEARELEKELRGQSVEDFYLKTVEKVS